MIDLKPSAAMVPTSALAICGVTASIEYAERTLHPIGNRRMNLELHGKGGHVQVLAAQFDRAESVVCIGLGYCGLYLIADAFALPHKIDDIAFAPWNAAPALSLALLARLGPRWVPMAIVAPLLASLAHDVAPSSWPWIVFRAVFEAGSTMLAANLMSAPSRGGDFARLRTVVTFFAAIALASAGITFARMCDLLATASPDISAISVTGRIFVATIAAFACLAPVVTFYDLVRARRLRWPPISFETVLQVLALGAIASEVFGRFANAEIHFFYLLFLPVAWITTRHGQRGAALALAFVYLSSVASDWMLFHDPQSAFELQIRLSVLAVTALLLGTMVSERRQSQELAVAQQNELAHLQRLSIGWEMASALAHELNQPLSAAMNYSQAASRLISGPAPDVQRAVETLAKSVSQIEVAGQTIHGLRNFMRKGELRLEPMRVADAVERAFRLVTAEANAANVTLRAVSVSDLPSVRADQVQIAQVLVNLLRNALQAIAEARMEEGVVTVVGTATGNSVAVSVSDTGPGIAPEIVDRVFMPFVTTKASGMGLGLAISKSILEAHGGDLHAASSAHGASFTVTLPLASAEAGNA